jgi:hypothetical protein
LFARFSQLPAVDDRDTNFEGRPVDHHAVKRDRAHAPMTKADPSVRNGQPRGVIGPNTIAERTAKRSSATAVTGAKPDATRRTQILKTANAVIATSGLRTSLQQIADAAGFLPEVSITPSIPRKRSSSS